MKLKDAKKKKMIQTVNFLSCQIFATVLKNIPYGPTVRTKGSCATETQGCLETGVRYQRAWHMAEA